ncbi:abortive infection family protein [Rhizobium sp. BK251]|uniref:abortive infection family protein n=1 Tax=Rhizobium sp. BK251 TaxID=2512125 RepID=UPI00105298C8|nr:abortive infection family protein [Rhizobium sp. BK251]TCL72123.1 abortive infection Abi-like protein [Rhizobium sp. BK251]
MRYTLQMLRELMEIHPDRAESLRIHVEALERSIEIQPAFCLQSVRTLFEAAHATIGPRLGVVFGKDDNFQQRTRALLNAMDFSVADHPDTAKINDTITKLLGSINGAALALAELSNIPNMRHGGSLDWGTLQRQHALMLGGLCDSLVAFLFNVAWSRSTDEDAADNQQDYDDYEAFNAFLDSECDPVEIASAIFDPSYVLFHLDETAYDAARIDWEAESTVDVASDSEAAA